MTTTVNNTFIRGLYTNVLQETGDQAGINYWQAQADAGVSAADITSAFINSAQGKQVESIIRLYETFFNRAPDSAGLNDWVNLLYSGTPLQNIASAFGSSPEFEATYAGTTTTTYVKEIYTNLFGRASDPAGEAYWVNQIDSGAMSRTDVALAFSTSPEALLNSSAATRFAESYLSLRAAGILEPSTGVVKALAAINSDGGFITLNTNAATSALEASYATNAIHTANDALDAAIANSAAAAALATAQEDPVSTVPQATLAVADAQLAVTSANAAATIASNDSADATIALASAIAVQAAAIAAGTLSPAAITFAATQVTLSTNALAQATANTAISTSAVAAANTALSAANAALAAASGGGGGPTLTNLSTNPATSALEATYILNAGIASTDANNVVTANTTAATALATAIADPYSTVPEANIAVTDANTAVTAANTAATSVTTESTAADTALVSANAVLAAALTASNLTPDAITLANSQVTLALAAVALAAANGVIAASGVAAANAELILANANLASVTGGGETFTLTSGILSYVGTIHDDTFIGTYNAGAPADTFTSSDVIDGLAGIDTLIINHLIGDAVITPPDTLWTGITNIEKIVINTSGNGAQTINTGDFFQTAFQAAGVDFTTTTSGAGAININMAVAGHIFTGATSIHSTSLAGAQTIVTGSGVDTVTASSDAGALTISGEGLTSVTATTTGAGAQTIGDNVAGHINLVAVTATSNSGAQTITSISDGNVTVTAASTSGAQTILLTGTGTNVVTSTTGVGTTNFISVTGSGSHTISAGAGNYLITGGSGVDTIAGGSGTDTFAFGANGSVIGTSMDSVSNFTTLDVMTFGGDTGLISAGTIGSGATISAGGLITFGGGTTTLADMITAVQASTQLAAVGTAAMFINGDNTYFYYAGLTTASTDNQLIQLTGSSIFSPPHTTISAGATTQIV